MSERERRVLHTGKYLNFIQEKHWEYAERPVPGAVVIIAVTGERKLLLVEQFRIPLNARTLELPAGIVGDEPGSQNEAFADTAIRELEEETGFVADEMRPLITGPTSGGLTSEMVTFFHAKGLRRVGSGGGVAGEGITLHEAPLEGIHEWLDAKAREGIVIDPKIYTGLYFLSRDT